MARRQNGYKEHDHIAFKTRNNEVQYVGAASGVVGSKEASFSDFSGDQGVLTLFTLACH